MGEAAAVFEVETGRLLAGQNVYAPQPELLRALLTALPACEELDEAGWRDGGLAAVAKLAAAALAQPAVRAEAERQQFLWRFPGATGLTAGYAPEAGYSCILTAMQDGIHLGVVVFGAGTENHLWLDAVRWLDLGFRHYERLLEEPMIADGDGYRPSAHP